MIKIGGLLLAEIHETVGSGPIPNRSAYRLVQRMGPNLARWIATRDLLRSANSHSGSIHGIPLLDAVSLPPLPTSPGSCWVLFVAKPPRAGLREAFVLPFKWQKDQPHRGLPPDVERVAREVHDEITKEYPGLKEKNDRWGLCLSPEAGLADYDLSGLSEKVMPAESGWAAIAGGLVTAIEDCKPEPKVFASACRRDRAFAGVSHLAAKKRLAAALDAEWLYVAQQDAAAPELDDDDATGPKIESISSSQGEVLPALNGYLERLGVKPGRHASEQGKRNYFSRIPREKASEYYIDYLLEEVAGRLKTSAPARVDLLTVFLSHSYELVLLAFKVFRPRRLLLCYSQAVARPLELVKQKAMESGFSPQTIQFQDADDVTVRIPEEVQRFLAIEPATGPIVFEATGGRKDMTIAQTIAFQECRAGGANCFLAYIEQDFAKGRTLIGTEKLRLFSGFSSMPKPAMSRVGR